MENYEINKAKEMCNSRQESHKKLSKESKVYTLLSKSIEDHLKQEGKNKIDKTNRHLILLGMSLAKGSESMIEWSVNRALINGATSEAIKEVFELTLLEFGGSAIAHVRFGYGALELRLREKS